MAEKRYYWLKLQDDFFNSKRIKKLRKIAGGDTYTIIYLKMQLLAMKQDGILEYSGLEPTFAEELALDLDEAPDNVAVTVNYLLSCGLLETADNKEFFMPYAVLNTGSEGASAKRVREYRENQKALQCNAGVTAPLQIGNGEKEKEKEKRREREEEEEDSSGAPAPAAEAARIDYQAIVDLFHTHCPRLPKVAKISEARKKAIKARLNAGYDLEALFKKAGASDFLAGANDRNWRADFDWVLTDKKAALILEGKYDNKPAPGPIQKATGWNPDDYYKRTEGSRSL